MKNKLEPATQSRTEPGIICRFPLPSPLWSHQGAGHPCGPGGPWPGPGLCDRNRALQPGPCSWGGDGWALRVRGLSLAPASLSLPSSVLFSWLRTSMPRGHPGVPAYPPFPTSLTPWTSSLPARQRKAESQLHLADLGEPWPRHPPNGTVAYGGGEGALMEVECLVPSLFPHALVSCHAVGIDSTPPDMLG